MIGDRFSSDAFAKLGLDSKESRELASDLEEEVNREMRQIIEENFIEIIRKLNSMGHNLKLEQDSELGEISFRDDNQNGKYQCKLRLAFDYVTSAGYPDLLVGDSGKGASSPSSSLTTRSPSD